MLFEKFHFAGWIIACLFPFYRLIEYALETGDFTVDGCGLLAILNSCGLILLYLKWCYRTQVSLTEE